MSASVSARVVENYARSERDAGIDAFRYLMAVLVIALHVLPFSAPESKSVVVPFEVSLVRAMARCAVPFFFISGGYYLRGNRPISALLTRPLRRIAPIFVAWMLIYAVVGALLSKPLPIVTLSHDGVATVANGGVAFHLWFLPALMVGLMIVGVGCRVLGAGVTGAIVILLAAAGPVAFDYLPLFGLRYPAALWPFYRHLGAPAFVFAGYAMRGSRTFPVSIAAAFVAIGYFLTIGEETLLTYLRGRPGIDSYDVGLATVVFGPAVFILAQSLNANRLMERIAPLGRLGLGVYLVHLAVIWVVVPNDKVGGFSSIIPVALCSTLLVAILVRLPGARLIIR